MKLLTRCFYALIFIGSSLILNAGIEPTVSIRCQKEQSLSLHLKGMKNETFNIKLSDEFGYTFINENVKDQDDYLKFFNLEKLNTGNYLIRIENERKIFLQTIRINNKKISIKTSDKKEIYKPTVNFKYPNLDLNMLHFEEKGVDIAIKDKSGYVLHKDEVFSTGSITKRFKITALPFGDYTFEIRTNNYTFEQKFSIDSKNQLNVLRPLISGE